MDEEFLKTVSVMGNEKTVSRGREKELVSLREVDGCLYGVVRGRTGTHACILKTDSFVCSCLGFRGRVCSHVSRVLWEVWKRDKERVRELVKGWTRG